MSLQFQFQLPFILVGVIFLLFAILFSIRPIGKVLLKTHVKFMKWVFRRKGECDIDALSIFYAKLFFAACAGLFIALFALDILSKKQSEIVSIVALVMLTTSFIPTYIYLLKDERYFRKQ